MGRRANTQNEANFRLRRVGRHRRRRGARGNHAKRTQFARQGQPGRGRRGAGRGANAQNEAKPGQTGVSGGRRVRGTCCAKRTQFARRGLAGQGLGTWDKGQMRKTNPICPATSGGTGPAGQGTRGRCAKRTQFARQGQPGRGRRGVGRGANAQNEAKPGQAGAPGGRRVGGTCCAKRTQFARRGRAGQGLGTWDEGQMRKTNPICPATSGGTGPAGQGTRGRCAKRSQFPPGRFPAGVYRAKQSQFTARARKTIAKARGLDAATRRTIAGADCARRTQFPPPAEEVGLPMPDLRRAAGAERAKRSQFGPGARKGNYLAGKELW